MPIAVSIAFWFAVACVALLALVGFAILSRLGDVVLVLTQVRDECERIARLAEWK
jgi:hypothetical protein